MLHPEFFTSRTLARVSVRAMVTFAGLWIYCDDYGRGEDDPSFVTASIWPRRTVEITVSEVEEDLKMLADHGTICRYEVGGTKFLHIPSWFEHQKVSHPTNSKLPPCHKCERLLYNAWWRDDDTATDRYRKEEKRLQAAKTNGDGSLE